MHHREVKVDLRVNRRESGLSQADLAVLLHTDQPRISRLEQGKSVLTISEICKLAVIYNHEISQLFKVFNQKIEGELWNTLRGTSGKSDPSNPLGALRQQTLHSLHQRLSVKQQNSHV